MSKGRNIRIFSLINDEIYDWKGEKIQLHKGDDFYGGFICEYPSLRDYAVVRNHKRIWFSKEIVENSPKRFKESYL